MIKISEDIKKLYIEDGTPIELEVRFKDNAFPTIKGSDVLSEQMTLHESICEEEQLKFGGCNASSFEITVYGLDSNIKDYEIEPVIITNGEEIPLGTFYVDTIEKFAGKDYKKLTAYDKMRYFDVDVKDWYESLTFPISVKNFRDSLCGYIGVEQNETTLIVDNIMLEKNLDSTSGINGLSLMRSICEISGVFGRMDRGGKFDYLSLESSMLLPSDDLYPGNNLYPSAGGGNSKNSLNIPSSITYEHPLVEDFFTAYVDGVIVVDSEGAQVITDYNDNPYYINDNFVIIGQTHDTIKVIADALLAKIGSISYRPVNSSKIKGQPYAECGDFISGEISGYGYEAYIFSRDMTGIKALRDSYTCKGKQYLENDMNGITATLQRLNNSFGKVKISLQKTEEGLRSDISKVEKETKQYTDNSYQELDNKISNDLANYSTTEEMNSAIMQSAEGISSTVSKRIEETKQYTDNSYQELDNKISNDLANYSTTEETETKINQSAEGVLQYVSLRYQTNEGAEEQYKEFESEINQQAQEIVLKVDANGRIVEVGLMANPNDGTEFKVTADNINLSASDIINLLAGGTINLSAGAGITFASPNFNLTKEGKMSSKEASIEGDIIAKSFKSEFYYNNEKYSELLMSGDPVEDSLGYLTIRELVSLLGSTLRYSTMTSSSVGVYEEGYPAYGDYAKMETAGFFTNGMASLGSSPIISSDACLKKSIEKLSGSEKFIYSLRPVQYKYKINQSDRYHHGFIAQEVKECMGNEDWGVYCDSHIDTGESGGKAIRYEELIADLVATVQSQNERIKKLEEKLGE